MKIEWLSEARSEFRDLLTYYRAQVGADAALKFSRRILDSIRQLEHFPELGVKKEERLMGRYGFRALFINQYVCIYRLEGEIIYIYHLADARTNYMYHIFGVEP